MARLQMSLAPSSMKTRTGCVAVPTMAAACVWKLFLVASVISEPDAEAFLSPVNSGSDARYRSTMLVTDVLEPSKNEYWGLSPLP